MSASVLICPFARRTWGHLTRCFALGRALATRGHRVRFACLAAARPRVEEAGFAHVELEGMLRQELLRRPRSAREAAAARRWLASDLRAARACLRANAPDVVVADLQPIVGIAAALDAVPSASLLNLELLAWPLAWWVPALERILGELDVPRWAAGRMFGDALLVADAAGVAGLRDLPPALTSRIAASVREVRFVGPLLGELPPGGAAARRSIARRPRPEVIVSLGGGAATGIEEIVAGCAAVDADLVVVAPEPPAGLVRIADELRRGGRGVTIVDFLPDFARRIAGADALITHGGHGTLTQALALAVPTLVVPDTREQEINAKRLAGVGVVASPNRSEIRATIGGQLAALLRDRAGDAARARLAEELAACGGADDAARVVEQLARQPPLGAPR